MCTSLSARLLVGSAAMLDMVRRTLAGRCRNERENENSDSGDSDSDVHPRQLLSHVIHMLVHSHFPYRQTTYLEQHAQIAARAYKLPTCMSCASATGVCAAALLCKPCRRDHGRFCHQSGSAKTDDHDSLCSMLQSILAPPYMIVGMVG